MSFRSVPLIFLLIFNYFGLIISQDVNFYLFRSNTPKDFIKTSKETIFDENSRVVFLIHGWHESHKKTWMENLKNAFLTRFENANVIKVDWSQSASRFYPFALQATGKIGKLVAEFIFDMVQNHKIPIQNFQLCGHSLGSHVAGIAGKHLQTLSLKLPKIIALDPAGVFIQKFPVFPELCLSKNDAEVVVALHTDSWIAGCAESLGTMDIYPNGRPLVQKGCPDTAGGNWVLCSHQRSHQYFIDALEHPNTLVATLCQSYEIFRTGGCKGNKQIDLGGDFGVGDSGDYFLDTGFKKPYGLGAESNKLF